MPLLRSIENRLSGRGQGTLNGWNGGVKPPFKKLKLAWHGQRNGVLFGGIIAFLYSDFIVIPSLRINATYYDWRFAAYLAAIFTVPAVGAGIVMHALFWLLGLIPEPEAGSVQQLAQFRIDYVFFLNIAPIAVSAALLWLWWTDQRRSTDDRFKGWVP